MKITEGTFCVERRARRMLDVVFRAHGVAPRVLSCRTPDARTHCGCPGIHKVLRSTPYLTYSHTFVQGGLLAAPAFAGAPKLQMPAQPDRRERWVSLGRILTPPPPNRRPFCNHCLFFQEAVSPGGLQSPLGSGSRVPSTKYRYIRNWQDPRACSQRHGGGTRRRKPRQQQQRQRQEA